MISYEKYAEIRKSKGLKDCDVSRIAGIPQSTFSEWKKGNYQPKYDKMVKIATALEMSYAEFMGVNTKVPELHPAIKEVSHKTAQIPQLEGMQNLQSTIKKMLAMFPDLSPEDLEMIRLYRNATNEARHIVMAALEASQKEGTIPSLSSKEA